MRTGVFLFGAVEMDDVGAGPPVPTDRRYTQKQMWHASTRLLDMGVEPFLLSSVLTGLMAQRLVRRLCQVCRVPYAPGAELAGHSSEVGMALPRQLFHPAGCEACGHGGYSGRIAVFEFLPVDNDIARLILGRADTREIAAAGLGKGMRTLACDGFQKAESGQTSLEEVLRVTSGE